MKIRKRLIKKNQRDFIFMVVESDQRIPLRALSAFSSRSSSFSCYPIRHTYISPFYVNSSNQSPLFSNKRLLPPCGMLRLISPVVVFMQFYSLTFFFPWLQLSGIYRKEETQPFLPPPALLSHPSPFFLPGYKRVK